MEEKQEKFCAPQVQHSKSATALTSTNLGDHGAGAKYRSEFVEAAQQVENQTSFKNFSSRHREGLREDSGIQLELSNCESQNDEDPDVQVDDSPLLSQEAIVTPVDAVLVETPDEPIGASSIMIAGRDYPVFTKNMGTTLRVALQVTQSGKEVCWFTPFPFIPTFVGECAD